MRSITFIFLLMIMVSAMGQSHTAAETLKNYSFPQKQLLVASTFQYAAFVTQGNCDEDSLMNMAGEITGMPFLLPYQEGLIGVGTTAIASLINSGSIDAAKIALEQATRDRRIQGLLEMALWYLHQDGTRSQDLDSAARFIQLAQKESAATGDARWTNECLFQVAELQLQKGSVPQSMAQYKALSAAALQTGKIEMAARAYLHMGDLYSPADSLKGGVYYKSLKMYESLGNKEKQVELLWRIAFCHERADSFSLAEKDLRKIISIADSTGFKHNLFAQTHLSYIFLNIGNYLAAMEYARAGLENMQWSGLSEVQGACYIRMATAYGALGQLDESVQWLKKALSTGTEKNHLFWYSGIFFLVPIVAFEGKKPDIALSMTDSIIRLAPPITVWEKLEVLLSIGVYHQLLSQPKLADKYYREMLQLARRSPLADPYGVICGDYLYIAEFYLSRNKLAMARVFVEQSLVNTKRRLYFQHYRYSIYYKIDSLKGNYKSALQNHIKYKYYYDADINMDQRKKMDELTVKYAAAKKEQDIQLLKQQGIVQQAKLEENRFQKNVMVVGTILLLLILGLLYTQYSSKQRLNGVMRSKNLLLQRLVDEKEWLLKEVHHRVKNNLHTVISLLESQAAYLENDALKAIESSQHRIYAMSLIHQKLYQSEDIKTIDMAVYLPEFIRYLDESFDTHYRIQFQVEVESVHLGISQAIPIALIINEAVSNSIKYAFPGNKRGKISIAMHQYKERVTLIIADNGIGIDKSMIDSKLGSLGLRLIKGLSEDINAGVAFQNENGTKISMVFNVDLFNRKNVAEIWSGENQIQS